MGYNFAESMGPRGNVKHLINQKDRDAEIGLIELIECTYEQLRKLAVFYLRRERADHPLQPTELVHEAYCELLKQRKINLENRAHFFWMAGKLMRRILCDHARRQKSVRNGGALQRSPLKEALLLAQERSETLVALDEALDRLALRDPLLARVVEMRFFYGATEEEIATLLDVSVRTVKRQWSLARVWLRREIGK